ncbi:MAG: hypothetical protein QG670_925 [Thermoproteota archaeon]|nr:hypothetical protein [Thermoproteota archaeon]
MTTRDLSGDSGQYQLNVQPGRYPFDYPTQNPHAPHLGHSSHLCEMVRTGQVSLEKIKDLVKNPKFICNICGRVAAKSENLCDPVKL